MLELMQVNDSLNPTFISVESIHENSYVKRFIFLGALSGTASVLGVMMFNPTIEFLPGILFGIIIGGNYFVVHRKVPSFIKFILFIIFSTIGYIAAYFSTTFTGVILVGNPFRLIIIPLLAGLFGSLILLIGYHICITPHTVKQFITLLFLGGVLSLSTYIIPDGLLFSSGIQIAQFPASWLFSLFIFWQTGMAGAIGWTIFSNNRPQASSQVDTQRMSNLNIIILSIIVIFIILLAFVQKINEWQDEKAVAENMKVQKQNKELSDQKFLSAFPTLVPTVYLPNVLKNHTVIPITKDDNGKTISTKVGDVIEIIIPSITEVDMNYDILQPLAGITPRDKSADGIFKLVGNINPLLRVASNGNVSIYVSVSCPANSHTGCTHVTTYHFQIIATQ